MENQVIDSVKTETKYCDYCHSEEGKLRLVGQFIVKLRTVNVFGEKKQVCQTCLYKQPEIKASRRAGREKTQDMGLFHLKKVVALISHACFLILVLSLSVNAQPGLPSAPSQAPIDGGLGLLAAAGGAYAIKKLRGRHYKTE